MGDGPVVDLDTERGWIELVRAGGGWLGRSVPSRPCQWGRRFSAKARAPSCTSSEARTGATTWSCCANASVSSNAVRSVTARLMAATAIGVGDKALIMPMSAKASRRADDIALQERRHSAPS